MADRYLVDVPGTYESYDGGTRPVIVYRKNDETEISQLQAYERLGINNDRDNSNVVIFIHGFNFDYSYAAEVFNKIVDKICANNRTNSAKFICLRWKSSVNDINTNVVGRLFTFVGGIFPGAVGDEIKKTGNSGPIYHRYIEDLERVADSYRGISWLINDLARSKKRVHLIGHSMGCQAVVNSLSFMCHDNSVLTSPYYGGHNNAEVSDTVVENIRNVFLIAPDVNTGIFKIFVVSDMDKLTRLNEFIIYSNNDDIAIILSELIRVRNHRLGRSRDAENSLSNILNELGELQSIRTRVNKIDTLDIADRMLRTAFEDVIFAVPRALASRDYPFSHNYYTSDNICHDIGRVIFGSPRNNVYHHHIVNNTYCSGKIAV